jgi:hypothetical protein
LVFINKNDFYYLGATSLFDLFMGGGRGNHRHRGEPKGDSKIIPLKYAVRLSTISK